jgi:hypothetical protein
MLGWSTALLIALRSVAPLARRGAPEPRSVAGDLPRPARSSLRTPPRTDAARPRQPWLLWIAEFG